MLMKIMEDAGRALIQLREKRPLVHHITNFVTMTDCANVTLAIGASPTMTDAVEEVAEMAGAAAALVLNLGTLQACRLQAMQKAGDAAAKKGIPIILDPVGAGGTTFRTEAARQLVQSLPVTVIRGNVSEITCLAAHQCNINLGVDNQAKTVMTTSLVRQLAATLGTTVVVTGATDAVSDGHHAVLLGNGCAMLPYVTGTGCMTTSLIASFAAVTGPFLAATAGVTVMGIAGETAWEQGGDVGPGSFHAKLFDTVYQMTPERIQAKGKVLTYDE